MTARRGGVRIGIFSAPMPTAQLAKAESYLQRDYIQWVEMSGALPVIIPYNTQFLDEYLNSVNGVVWIGGAIENAETHDPEQYHTLQKVYEHTFQHATRETRRGNYYPIWGTCLGFDFLALMGQHSHSLGRMPHIHKTQSGTLRFQGASRLRRVFPRELQRKMAREPVTRQLHARGYDPASPHTLRMHNYLKVISLDRSDESPRQFVNAFEYKHFPFYGTQWHPEKPMSDLSRNVAQRLSCFLKKECAKNRNRSTWTPPTGKIRSTESVLVT
jgi:gamma-glutamyl hydrolase